MLAAAHLDNDPGNNRLRNLRSLCQRCHLVHDRAWHLLQRWITYRLRYACGGLFLGPYQRGRDAALVMGEILARIAQQLSAGRAMHRPRSPSSCWLLRDNERHPRLRAPYVDQSSWLETGRGHLSLQSAHPGRARQLKTLPCVASVHSSYIPATDIEYLDADRHRRLDSVTALFGAGSRDCWP